MEDEAQKLMMEGRKERSKEGREMIMELESMELVRRRGLDEPQRLLKLWAHELSRGPSKGSFEPREARG